MAADRKQQREVTSRARRKLLKLAVYTPPVILGTLLISRDAMAQPASPCQPDRPCKPAICSPQPCGPAPCGPYPYPTRQPGVEEGVQPHRAPSAPSDPDDP